ncbi:MAG: hypothetical protein ABGZ36_07520, partial [Actinomycetota bacterium]
TWDLDHEIYRSAVAGAVTHLKGCLADPQQYAPNMYNWKTRAEELEACGLKLKQTRGRTDVWIDRQNKMLLEALVLEHLNDVDLYNSELDGFINESLIYGLPDNAATPQLLQIGDRVARRVRSVQPDRRRRGLGDRDSAEDDAHDEGDRDQRRADATNTRQGQRGQHGEHLGQGKPDPRTRSGRSRWTDHRAPTGR